MSTAMKKVNNIKKKSPFDFYFMNNLNFKIVTFDVVFA